MSQATKALGSASRRELQALAKELQLCRGNAKSDVIVSHAMQFLEDHPKDGEHQVMGVLGGSAGSSPAASPMAKKKKKQETPKKQEATVVASVKVNTSVKQTKSSKQQPEDEPSITVKSVEVVQTKTTVVAVQKKSMPKDKKKAKQTPSPATTKSSPTTAAPGKSPKASVKASPSTKKSATSKMQPAASVDDKKKADRKKEQPAVSKKAAPVGKKAEVKARKTLEALVKSIPDLSFVGDSRVRCSTTGHEMKADVDVISAYIHGKRYQKARNLKLSFAKFAPMFVDHPDESMTDMLWCNVTESAIARDVKRVEAHILAPKYQKELPIWKEQEAAKKKAEEEEAQRRAARIAAAKKRRLEATGDDAAKTERPLKRKRTAAADRK